MIRRMLASVRISRRIAVTSRMSGQLRYRADVDGLRAIAVLGVVAFHAGLLTPGGYVGVDIFFVISGYLITGLIQKAQQQNRFSLVDFWIRRIRRIVPAASVMVLVTLCLGLLLLPIDSVELAESAIFQQLMIANVYFFRDSGYFDGPSDLKPLLHTWSLAVEEQFYLGYPFLLVLLHRFRRSVQAFALFSIFLVSLGISIWGVAHYPNGAFFLLPSRAWELLLGCLIWFLPKPKQEGLLISAGPWIGLFFIGASYVLFDQNTPFPGLAAMLPCIGAVAIIHYGNEKSRLTRMLSTRPMVYVGLLSYSLYLWHWPLFAITRYWVGRELTWAVSVLLIVASFGLAWGSMRFVETPFRAKAGQSFNKRRLRPFLFTVASACVLIAMSALVIKTDGFPNRFSKGVLRYTAADTKIPKGFRSSLDQAREGEFPRVGSDADAMAIDFLVWGDSHAIAIARQFDELAVEHEVSGRLAAKLGTPPLLGVWNSLKGRDSIEWNDRVLNYVKTHDVKHVIFAARWAAYLEGTPDGKSNTVLIQENHPDARGNSDANDAVHAMRMALERTVSELDALGVGVWFVGQVPVQLEDPRKALSRAAILGKGVPIGVHRSHHDRRQAGFLQILGNAIPGGNFFDPTADCVNSDGFTMIGSAEGSYYADDDHVSPYGAEVLVRPALKRLFDAMTIRDSKTK